MSVGSGVPYNAHTGNGLTTVFAYGFTLLDAADLVVTIDDVVTSAYTVAGLGVAAGGSITFSVAPTTGAAVLLQRVIQLVREAEYQTNGDLQADTLNGDFDRLWMAAQQGDVTGGRSIRVPELAVLPELPEAASRANTVLAFDADGDPICIIPVSGSAADVLTRLADTADAAKGDALLGVKSTLPGAVGRTQHDKNAESITVLDVGADKTGASDAAAVINALLTAIGRGYVELPKGTYLATAPIVVPSGMTLRGCGFSEENGVGSSYRGATCILRGFAGTSATILASGDHVGLDLIDVDNNAQGTGPCVQVTGSRFNGGTISTRNSGGDGFRVGVTAAGALETNSNCGRLAFLITCGNAGTGARWDDTNTSTDLSFPLGTSNANSWMVGNIDARVNGTDGVQIGNANDNVFMMVSSQSNTGCGIRFKTDGTNAGPRANKVFGNDCESNTGNDIQIDAATLPAAAPGLYNIVMGNRSVAVNPRIVDNSTGSLVLQWRAGLPYRAYEFGTDINVANLAGNAGYNLNVGANLAPARVYAVASGTVDSILKAAVHKLGGALTDAWMVNNNAVFVPLTDLFALTYSASITIDASQGRVFQLSASSGVAFTLNAPTNPQTGQEITLIVRNTSGGALGAVTWNAAFKLAAWTSPANGFSRTISFRYDGTNWVEINRTTVDVPN